MKEIWWAKIATDTFDDEKLKIIESMPDNDAIELIWVKLILLATKNYEDGFVLVGDNIPCTDEMLASIFNRPLNTIRLAMGTFVKLSMVEVTEKGYLIVNLAEYQNIDELQKIRQQTRERVSRYRERQKERLLPEAESTDVTLRNADVTQQEGEGGEEGGEETGRDIDTHPVGNTPSLERGFPKGREPTQTTISDSPLGSEKTLKSLIHSELLKNYRRSCMSNDDNENGKQPSAKIMAQLRDLSVELTAYSCPVEYIVEAFKEMAFKSKADVRYARAILFSWLGVEKK